MLYILKAWSEDPPPQKSTRSKEKTKFSILIPARNEEENILNCLHSIIRSIKAYQAEIEILVIDDHSEDKTYELVRDLEYKNLKIIKLQDTVFEKINAYKKAALNLGVSLARHPYIIQLDADVIVPDTYLNAVNDCIVEHKPTLITAPVLFYPSSGWFESFQNLDMMGMMAVTQAGIKTRKWFMANGANMIYKSTEAIFDQNELASGDDIYKIQKQANSNSERIYYLKDQQAIVTTLPEKSFSAFYKQRIRWATKNKLMKDERMLMVMAIPFVNAALVFISLFLIPFWGMQIVILCCVQVLLKMSVDFIFLSKVSQFFKQKRSMDYFLVSNLFHTIYILFIGVLSLFIGQYEWKGRKVN